MKIIYAAFIILPIVMLALSVFVAVRKNAKGATGKKAFGSHLKVLGVLVVMLACLTVGAYAAQGDANDVKAPETSDVVPVAETGEAEPVAQTADGGLAKGLGYIAAALAVGLAGIGAGISIAAGSPAAIGATSEDPKMFGKAMIFCVLGEAIAIYGLVISFMILLV